MFIFALILQFLLPFSRVRFRKLWSIQRNIIKTCGNVIDVTYLLSFLELFTLIEKCSRHTMASFCCTKYICRAYVIWLSYSTKNWMKTINDWLIWRIFFLGVWWWWLTIYISFGTTMAYILSVKKKIRGNIQEF